MTSLSLCSLQNQMADQAQGQDQDQLNNNDPPPPTLCTRRRAAALFSFLGTLVLVALYLSYYFQHKQQGFLCNKHVVVAQDGSGNFQTISQAVEASPDQSKKRHCIFIKSGIYYEIVQVPYYKKNLVVLGQSRTETIISSNQSGFDLETLTPSATLDVQGDGFIAVDITFENLAGFDKKDAMALFTRGMDNIFYRCTFKSHQGTVNLFLGRHFLSQCEIYGTTSIIYGGGAAVLQDCKIYVGQASSHQKNIIITHNRDNPIIPSGFIFQSCNFDTTPGLIPSVGSTFLGSPSAIYARIVIMDSYLGSIVNPLGWISQNIIANNTIFFAEYENFGLGAVTKYRVKWYGAKILSYTRASRFTANIFLNAKHWLAPTEIPYRGNLD